MSVDDFPSRDWKYWTQPTIIDIDGVPTAYRRDGAGEVVVYLHGAEATRAWLPVHRFLSNDVDLIAPEHPGFGDTPRPAEWDEWEDWILHYDTLLRTLGTEPVHLVGNSLGAWLAANLAAFYPGRFASLTLIAPHGVRTDPTVHWADPFRPVDGTGHDALFNGRGAELIAELGQEGEFEDGIRRFAEGATAAVLTFNPRYDIKFDYRLRRIESPTLVLAPEEDRLYHGAAQRFADLIPGAELRVVGGDDRGPSGHGMVLEQPAVIATSIIDHVRAGAR
ncbi:alpha/beta fold hydrolase [Gordonia sp. NPDC003376]